MDSLSLGRRASLIKPSPTLALTARAKEMKAEGIDVISLSVGEPDFNTPEPIIEAGIKALRDGHTKYAPTRGIPEFRKAIIEKVAWENKFECNEKQITVSCGAKHCIYNALQALLEEGDEVILLAPYWMTYKDQVILSDGTPVIVKTDKETNYCPTPEQIISAITPKTKAIILNTPCNPTGAAYPKELLQDITEICVDNGIWIISDEIYEHLIYGHEHTSVASLSPEVASQTITVLGCSKSYAMTGWRIGYAIAPENVTSTMASFQDQVTSNATTMSQYGAIAALNMDPSIVTGMRDTFFDRQSHGLELLRQIPNVEVQKPQGAFYFFADIRHYLSGEISNDSQLSEYLLSEARIAVVPGSVFEGEGHLRISYATNKETLTTAISRLKEALLSLN